VARRDPRVRDTKRDLSEAALKLFCERGYHAVTVEEIASAAGATKGAFYYYFSDKEDLARDLWHELWSRLAEAAQEVFDEKKPLAANLKRGFRATLEAISGLGEARFFLKEAWVLPAVEVAGRVDQQKAASLIGSLLAGAAEETVGGLDIDAVSAVLLGAYAEATLHILTTGDPEPTLLVLDRVIDALLATGHEESGRESWAPGTPRSRPTSARSKDIRGGTSWSK